jgi:hypothetical protein
VVCGSGVVLGCVAAAAVGGSEYQVVMARDKQLQVIPSQQGQGSILACLFIIVSSVYIAGLQESYSALRAHTSLTTQ